MKKNVIKLNLGGCEIREGGFKSPPLRGFTNVDLRPCRGVDVVCDIRELSNWKSSTVTEIRASHVIEHFEAKELPGILKEWHRVLILGGLLRVYCPDAYIIISQYMSGLINNKKFNTLLFGGQKYSTDFHKVALDRKRLDTLVEKAGFKIIDRLPRPNAYVYDLGVQAIKV